MSTAFMSEEVIATPLRQAARPSVSVIIPCYNEERFISQALENLADQYDGEDYELVVVDGMSDDRTRELVAEFKRSHPDLAVKLLDNPARNIPHALNLGIAAARGEIIARMDAHAAPSAGYVAALASWRVRLRRPFLIRLGSVMLNTASDLNRTKAQSRRTWIPSPSHVFGSRPGGN
jgi:glycosyltransferase involved in cell wall biosynthesis